MSIKFQYRPPDAGSGDLRTLVAFYEHKSTGFELDQHERIKLYECFAEAYNPSMKDLEIMNSKGTKEGVTIRIRDTMGEFTPTNKHFCEIQDYRYADKVFYVVDVRYDLKRSGFTTILLGYSS